MPDYIIEPLDTDSEVIFQNFVAYIQNTYPDWDANESQLDVMIGRFFSQQTAVVADMASRVQRSVYRYFGASLANIPPLIGSAATATISIHVTDGLAHTFPIGTSVGLTDDNGDLHTFVTLADLVIPEGAPEWQNVNAQANEIGAFGNQLTGDVQMFELFDWIDEATVSGASSGGSDAEEDNIYIQRLTENLAIPRRPTLATDMVTMAKNIPGVWRAAAIDNYRSTGVGTYATDLEDSIAISAIDINGEEIVGAVQDQLMQYLTDNLRQNFLLTWVSPTYNDIDVEYEAQAYKISGADAASIVSDIDGSLDFYLSPSHSGQGQGDTFDRSWFLTPVMRYLELTTIVENARSIDYTESLTFSVNGGTMDSSNKNLTGVFPLTRTGDLNGTVNVL